MGLKILFNMMLATRKVYIVRNTKHILHIIYKIHKFDIKRK